MTNVIRLPHKPQNVQHRLLRALENLEALNRSAQAPGVAEEMPSHFVSIGDLSLRVLQRLGSRQANGAV